MIAKRSQFDSFRAKQQADSAAEFTQIPKNQDQEIGPLVINSDAAKETALKLESHTSTISDSELQELISNSLKKSNSFDELLDNPETARWLEEFVLRISTGEKSARRSIESAGIVALLDNAALPADIEFSLRGFFDDRSVAPYLDAPKPGDKSSLTINEVAKRLDISKENASMIVAFVTLDSFSYNLHTLATADPNKPERTAKIIDISESELERLMSVKALSSKSEFSAMNEALFKKVGHILVDKMSGLALQKFIGRAKGRTNSQIPIETIRTIFGEKGKQKILEFLKNSEIQKSDLSFSVAIDNYEAVYGKISKEEFADIAPNYFEIGENDVARRQSIYFKILKQKFYSRETEQANSKSSEVSRISSPKTEQSRGIFSSLRSVRAAVVGIGLAALGMFGIREMSSSKDMDDSRGVQTVKIDSGKNRTEATQLAEIKNFKPESISLADSRLGVHEINYHDTISPEKRTGPDRFEIESSHGKQGYYREFAGTEFLRDQETGRGHWVNKEDFNQVSPDTRAPRTYDTKQIRSVNGEVRVPVREDEEIIAVVTADGASIEVYEENRTGNYVLKGNSSRVEIFTVRTEHPGYKRMLPNDSEKKQLIDFGALNKDWQLFLAELNSQKALTLEQKTAAIVAVWGENYVYHDNSKFDVQASGKSAEEIVASIINIHEGICNTSATGLVALLRSAGIPARTESGYMFDSNLKGQPHMWAEFWNGTEWTAIESLQGSSVIKSQDSEAQEEMGLPAQSAHAEPTKKLLARNSDVVSKFARTIIHTPVEGVEAPTAPTSAQEQLGPGSGELPWGYIGDEIKLSPSEKREVAALEKGGLSGFVVQRFKEKGITFSDIVKMRSYRYPEGKTYKDLTPEEKRRIHSGYIEHFSESLANALSESKKFGLITWKDAEDAYAKKTGYISMDGAQKEFEKGVEKWEKTISPNKAQKILFYIERTMPDFLDNEVQQFKKRNAKP